jgi:endonuclease-8
MPEGDTIARAAAALDRALAGRVVTAFATGLAPLARIDDDTPIAGRTIERAESRGKHLLLRLSGGLTLRTHMRMRGSWHLYRHGERWQRSPRAARIRIDTADWVAVAFDVPVAEFVRDADLARHRPLTMLGPDLGDPAFDRSEALARLAAAGPRPIGEAILDQRVIAGLGNVLRAETLFLAGVHPESPAGALGAELLARVVDTAAGLIQANARPAAGMTRNTTRRTAPGEALWVYQRTGQPCRRCGAAIRSAVPGVDARRIYWCPACQPAPAAE